MFQKWQKQGFWKLKRELPTMQVLKSGKTSRMITKVISGHWVASFTNLLHWILHSQQRTWRAFIKGLWKESTQKFHRITLLIYQQFLVSYFKSIRRKGLLVNNSYTCQFLWRSIMNLNFKSRANQLIVQALLTRLLKCLAPSKSHWIWTYFTGICHKAITKQTNQKEIKKRKIAFCIQVKIPILK